MTGIHRVLRTTSPVPRNSLVVCYIGRNELLDAVAEYRGALDVEPTAKEVKVALRDVGRQLILALQEENARQQIREVMDWIQELDIDSSSAEQLLDGDN